MKREVAYVGTGRIVYDVETDAKHNVLSKVPTAVYIPVAEWNADAASAKLAHVPGGYQPFNWVMGGKFIIVNLEKIPKTTKKAVKPSAGLGKSR